MDIDALYLVAMQRVADLQARSAHARLLAAVCAQCHCVARWREVIGHGLIAFGQWVEDARPLSGELGDVHWQGR